MDNYLAFYFNHGFTHITDINGYDHILFLSCIVLLYNKNIKDLIYLITGFTIGHCLSLFVVSTANITYNTDIIEKLIVITIIVTCLDNIRKKFHVERKDIFFIIVFGLIHGMGFSNYLRIILSAEENIMAPLLVFNLGLEVGQILILLVCITLISLTKIKDSFRAKIGISLLILGVSVCMLF